MTPLNPPVVSPKTYIAVLITLLLLLALNLGLAHINLGPFNVPATLGIPFVQILLMLLFLMHLRYDSWLTWVFAGAGFVWLVLLVG